MTQSKRTTIVASSLLLSCMLGAALVLQRVDRLRTAASLEEILYINSPSALRRMSLGYTGLLADVYWTRAVQYFGRKHYVGSMHYDLLYPLLNITTELDPHLTAAYEFGAIFLAQRPPDGAGMPDEAVKLVEKGIRANPDNWRLYYDLGFIHFVERKDYVSAARAFEAGSRVPGAHPWMKLLAARMAERGGDLDTARFLWSKTYENTEDQQIRASAAAHLRALQVDDDIIHLRAIVDQYRDKTGRWPASLADLVAAGYLPGIPADPLGNPYKLMENGRIEVREPDRLPFISQGLPPGYRAPVRPNLESK
jgi:tetratricopeptide (TPR) repeat protein